MGVKLDGWLGYVISLCIQHFVLHLFSGDGIGECVNDNVIGYLLTQNVNTRDWKGSVDIRVVLLIHFLITLCPSLSDDTPCSGLAGGI